MSMTTIAVKAETKESLRHLGMKGESYDLIIQKLIEVAQNKVMDVRWNAILEQDDFIPLDEL